MRRSLARLCGAGLGLASWAAGAGELLHGKLIVFHAGSLAVPMKEMAAAFQRSHPRLDIQLEAAGSVECARKITALGRECDVFASADYQVIDRLLVPEHAAWSLRFAANQMVLAYTEKSRRAGEIAPENWPDILLDQSVVLGRSDPNADPCGYRTVLALRLAEAHYRRPGLAETLLAKDTRFIRPKEVDLLALAEAHAVDYLFIYRSVAQQHGLKFLTLPDEVNLGNPALRDWYEGVSVRIRGNRPDEFIEQKGEPMVYGLTIPRNAPHPAAALAFARFILEADNGRRILERLGQPSVIPAPATGYEAIPEPLKIFAAR